MGDTFANEVLNQAKEGKLVVGGEAKTINTLVL